MGFLSKIFGGGDSSTGAGKAQGTAIVLRNREIAATLRRPEQANHGDDPQPPCERCGKPLAETLITTGGPTGDPLVWRDVPVAVDGWACVGCGVFRYPRKMLPDQIVAIGDEGATHGRAGRFADAELCFTRIAWDWPGYFAGHMNLAEATRDRLHASPKEDEAVRRRLTDRMVAEYEAAVEAYAASPLPGQVTAAARAYLTLGQEAIGKRSLDRALRMAEACLALDGVKEADAERARQLGAYVETRRDLFDEAAEALRPYTNLQDRPGREVATGEDRKRIVVAIEKLEQHLALAPDRWQAAWLIAMGKARLGDPAATRAAWERAHASFPDRVDIARERSLELLRQGANEEAHAVDLAITEAHPEDATLWCNLAVTSILTGDLDGAERAVKKSLAMDPKDTIARAVLAKVEKIRAGAPAPRTLAELSRP